MNTVEFISNSIRKCNFAAAGYCAAALLISMAWQSDVLAQPCEVGADEEIWVNTKGFFPTVRRIYRIDNITGTPNEILELDHSFPDLGDIGFAPDGTLYGVEFQPDVGDGSYQLVSIDISTGVFTDIVAMPAGLVPNALSFDENGFAYIGGGAAGNTTVYRVDPGTGTTTAWVDFGSGNSAGDFIFLNGFVYVAWDTSGAQTAVPTQLFRVTVDANNDYVSHIDLGRLPDTTFGLASLGGNTIYGVAVDDVFSFTPPASPVTTISTTTVHVMTNAAGETLNGATSKVEAIGNAETACITLLKNVFNDNLGTAVDTDFTLSFDNSAGNSGSGAEGNSAITEALVSAASGENTYTLSETGPSGYKLTDLSCTGTADSDPSDGLTLADEERVTCTFTNEDLSFDYGDVPQTYDGSQSTAAAHIPTSDLKLGVIAADENDAPPPWSSDATGDDTVFSGSTTLYDADQFEAGTTGINNPGNAVGAPNGTTANIGSGDVLILHMEAEIQNGTRVDVYQRGNASGNGSGQFQICTDVAATNCGAIIDILDSETTDTVQAVAYGANATGQYLRFERNTGSLRIDAVEHSVVVLSSVDDEDGVDTGSLLLGTDEGSGFRAWLNVTSVTNNLSDDAQLVCWMDFNQDGDFADTGERSNPQFDFSDFSSSGTASEYAEAFTGTGGGAANPDRALGAPDAPVTPAPGDDSGTSVVGNGDILTLDMEPGGTIPSGATFSIYMRGRYTVSTPDGTGRANIYTSPDDVSYTLAGSVDFTANPQTTIAAIDFTAPTVARYVRIERTQRSVAVDAVEYAAPASCNLTGVEDTTFTTGNVPAGCSGETWVQWTGIPSVPTSGTMFTRCRLTTEDGSTAGAADFFSDTSPSPTGPAGDGEVEDFEVPVVTTPAVVSNVSATAAADGGAVLSWLSAAELAAAAFRLERWHGDEPTGHWQRVHEDTWLPALGELQGGHYQIRDAAAEAGRTYRYRVVEKPVRGAPIYYGPYDVTVAAELSEAMPLGVYNRTQGRWDIDRILALEEQRQKQPGRARLQRAGGKAKTQAAAAAKPKTLKLTVGDSGIYSIDAQTLSAHFGVKPNRIKFWLRNGRFKLVSGGEVIAWHGDTEGNFYFYGEALDSLYSTARTYYLSRNRSGERMAELEVGSGSPVSKVFSTQRHYEEDALSVLSVTQDAAADIWFWDIVVSVSGYDSKTFELELPGAQAQAGSLSLNLWGGVDSSHRLAVSADGQTLGTVQFQGAVPHQAEFELPAELLADAALEVTVTVLDNPAGDFDSVLIEGFDLAYTRAYQAENNALHYPASRSTTVSGFTAGEIFTINISNPKSPVWVEGGSLDGGTYQARLPRGDYYTSGSLKTVLSITVDSASNLKLKRNRADYVVISSNDLMAGADALAAYRADLRTKVVSVEDIYDEFAYGVADPNAIGDFIQASRKWKRSPKYVVLVGDGSHDYRDILGTGYNRIGAILVAGENGLFASDTLLGDVDDDGKPEVAVGRIPAKTVDEVLAYVDKLAAYEGGAADLPTLLLSDNTDMGGHFAISSDFIGQEVQGQQTILSLEGQSVEQTRANLFAHLDQGMSLVNYIGHGGVDRVASEGLILNQDVATLNNFDTPVLVGLTCLINNYSIAGYDSVAERLVLRDGGGMVASWAASGESLNSFATVLGVDFHAQYRGSARLGDAIVETLANETQLVSVYTLLGDPAIVIH